MNAGRLSQRISIESRSSATDSIGGQSGDWATTQTLWAEVRQLGGRELLAAQALHSEVTHEIRIRYSASVTAANRIKYRGRVLEIVAAWNVDEANVETRIHASEGLTQG